MILQVDLDTRNGPQFQRGWQQHTLEHMRKRGFDRTYTMKTYRCIRLSGYRAVSSKICRDYCLFTKINEQYAWYTTPVNSIICRATPYLHLFNQLRSSLIDYRDLGIQHAIVFWPFTPTQCCILHQFLFLKIHFKN